MKKPTNYREKLISTLIAALINWADMVIFIEYAITWFFPILSNAFNLVSKNTEATVDLT